MDEEKEEDQRVADSILEAMEAEQAGDASVTYHYDEYREEEPSYLSEGLRVLLFVSVGTAAFMTFLWWATS